MALAISSTRPLILTMVSVLLAAFSLAAAQEAEKAQPAAKQPAAQTQTVTQPENQIPKLAKKDLPAAVLSAFEKTYRKAVIRAVRKDVQDSVTYWDIESKEGDVGRDLRYLSDGKVVRLREDIAAASLPAEAMASIAKEYPNTAVQKAEKILRSGVVEYRVWVSDSSLGGIVLLLDGAGLLVKREKTGQ